MSLGLYRECGGAEEVGARVKVERRSIPDTTLMTFTPLSETTTGDAMETASTSSQAISNFGVGASIRSEWKL